jgi:AAA domain
MSGEEFPNVAHLPAGENAMPPYHPAAPSGASSENGATAEVGALRTRGVKLERVRPLSWLWARRIPRGLPSLLIAEEGTGKGTLASWILARTTRGELEGDLHGQPTRVLVIGDEDGFDQIWVPRLYAAGADLEMVLTLDDGEFLDDFASAAVPLEAAIVENQVGLVLFDALVDHVPGGAAGEAVYNPKNVRAALMPLRRVAAATDVAAVGLLHPIKAKASTFRALVAGSHQFNAVSRSSLLLAPDPNDDRRRILVRGKGNHSAAPRSVEFAIAADVVELNGYTFEVPKVVDLGEGDRTIADLLGDEPKAPVRDALAEQLAPLLTDEPQMVAALARAVDRDPKDGSVRNALDWLQTHKRAKHVEKGWVRP